MTLPAHTALQEAAQKQSASGQPEPTWKDIGAAVGPSGMVCPHGWQAARLRHELDEAKRKTEELERANETLRASMETIAEELEHERSKSANSSIILGPGNGM